MNREEIYKSVLSNLSKLPIEYLQEIDDFLSVLSKRKKKDNVRKIMQLSGSWNDMEDEDFEDFLAYTKR